MREFGSDFHYICDLEQKSSEYQLSEYAHYYINGRQAIQDIIKFKKWKRIWMPEYFCYEIISSIRKTGIKIGFYFDNPSINEKENIDKITFQEGDVLFRMNYFGLRSKRDNSKITVPVIEDHSHDLIGDWSKNSNADYCVASLRKSLPIADGGILWSPKGHMLPKVLTSTLESESLVALRYKAMSDKADYLHGNSIDKDMFLNKFNKTEEGFEKLSFSGISNESYDIARKMDIRAWYEKKKKNWMTLSQILHPSVKVLQPKTSKGYPFSLVLKFNNKCNKDLVRDFLIENNVYPAILWQIPKTQNTSIVVYGETCLSVHCDGRYSIEEILILKDILSKAFKVMHL